MRLESEALRYILEIVSTGSIQAAARNLLISPSALSRQVKLLERELEVVLFERSARGMVPTAAGERLYEFAKKQAKDSRDLKHSLRTGLMGTSIDFHIACVEGVLPKLLPSWLTKLQKIHRNVRFVVSLISSTEVAAAVAEQRADVGFAFGRVDRLELREIVSIDAPIKVIVRDDHPLADQELLTFAQVQPYRFILPSQSFGIRREIDREMSRQGIRLRQAVETNSLAFALRSVEYSNMASFTTSIMLDANKQNNLKLIKIDEYSMNSTHLSYIIHSEPNTTACDQIKKDLAKVIKQSHPEALESAE